MKRLLIIADEALPLIGELVRVAMVGAWIWIFAMVLFGCRKQSDRSEPSLTATNVALYPERPIEDGPTVSDISTNLGELKAKMESSEEMLGTFKTLFPSTNSIFFVETPGGVQKVNAKGVFGALCGVGSTVWTEEQWREMTNGRPHHWIDVADRTRDWQADYVKTTNADGLFMLVDPRPAAKELLVISNIVALKFEATLIPLLGMTDDQVMSITNAYPERVMRIHRMVITTRDIAYIASQEAE